jgi:hypothetical protein
MQINDYYKILGLKYKFTPFQLLNHYFRKTKIALESGNTEEFITIRMGYEVLRDYKATEEYNRLYRKYILNEELNFPTVRENQMVSILQAREKVGAEMADAVIARQETFLIHWLKFFLGFTLIDINNIIPFGNCGVMFIFGGLFAIIKFHNQINIIGGILLILMGVFLYRRNMKWSIMLN